MKTKTMNQMMRKMMLLALVFIMIICYGCTKGTANQKYTDSSWKLSASDLKDTYDKTFTLKEGQYLQLDIDLSAGKANVTIADNSTGEKYYENEISESISEKIKCSGKVKITCKFSDFDGSISIKVSGKASE